MPLAEVRAKEVAEDSRCRMYWTYACGPPKGCLEVLVCERINVGLSFGSGEDTKNIMLMKNGNTLGSVSDVGTHSYESLDEALTCFT